MISPPSPGQALIFVCQQWHAISSRGTGAKTQVLILSTLMGLMVWRMRETASYWKCNALCRMACWTSGGNMMFICFYCELYWSSSVNIVQTDSDYANKNILESWETQGFFFYTSQCTEKMCCSPFSHKTCVLSRHPKFLRVFVPCVILLHCCSRERCGISTTSEERTHEYASTLMRVYWEQWAQVCSCVELQKPQCSSMILCEFSCEFLVYYRRQTHMRSVHYTKGFFTIWLGWLQRKLA